MQPLKTVFPPKNRFFCIALQQLQTYDTRYWWTWLCLSDFSIKCKAMSFFMQLHLPIIRKSHKVLQVHSGYHWTRFRLLQILGTHGVTNGQEWIWTTDTRIFSPIVVFVSICGKTVYNCIYKDLWDQAKISRRSNEGQTCMFGTHFGMRLVTLLARPVQ